MCCVASHRLCWFSVDTDWSSAPRPRHARRSPCIAAGTASASPGLKCGSVCVALLPLAPTAPRASPPLTETWANSRLPAAIHLREDRCSRSSHEADAPQVWEPKKLCLFPMFVAALVSTSKKVKGQTTFGW